MSEEEKQSVKAAFALCDLNGDGKIERNELIWILRKVGYEETAHDELERIMLADLDKDGSIDIEEFLTWAWNGAENEQAWFTGKVNKAVSEAAKKSMEGVELSVMSAAGTQVACLQGLAEESIAEVKQKVRDAGGPPVEFQQLVLDSDVLEDHTIVSSLEHPTSGLTVQLICLPPPPLTLSQFQEILTANCKDEELTTKLQDMFELRDIDGLLIDDCCCDDYDCGEDDENQTVDQKCGTPLWRLGKEAGSPERLAAVASWLLAKGANINAKWPLPEERNEYDDPTRTVMEACLHRKSAALLRVLLGAGEQPTLQQLLLALPVDSEFDRCAQQATCPYISDRLERTERVEEEIKGAEEFQDFILCLRQELFPAVSPLPNDLFHQQMSIREEASCSNQEESVFSFFYNQSERNICWLLAHLISHGVAWNEMPPEPPPLEIDDGTWCRGERPSEEELLCVQRSLEEMLKSNIIGAKLQVAIWRNDLATVRILLAQPICDLSWGCGDSYSRESPIITALKAESDFAIFEALLEDRRFDPNAGMYDYGWHGSFQLWSALGWIVEEGCNAYGHLEIMEKIIVRLATHKRVDLQFGKIQGGAPLRGSGDRNKQEEDLTRWFSDLRSNLTEFLSVCHEKYWQDEHDMNQKELDLRKDLELAKTVAQEDCTEGEEVDTAKSALRKFCTTQRLIESAAPLLELITRVEAGFDIQKLTAFPVADKLISWALSRWTGPCGCTLPWRALQVTLSFLPLWATSWSKEDCTEELILGCFDVPDICDSGRPVHPREVNRVMYSNQLKGWWSGEERLPEDDYDAS